LREVLTDNSGRNKQPSAVILDSRTSGIDGRSGHRAGWRRWGKGRRVAIAVDTLDCWGPARHPGERARLERWQNWLNKRSIEQLAEVAFADQGYTGALPPMLSRGHLIGKW